MTFFADRIFNLQRTKRTWFWIMLSLTNVSCNILMSLFALKAKEQIRVNHKRFKNHFSFFFFFLSNFFFPVFANLRFDLSFHWRESFITSLYLTIWVLKYRIKWIFYASRVSRINIALHINKCKILHDTRIFSCIKLFLTCHELLCIKHRTGRISNINLMWSVKSISCY